ncbi:hypothetical protein AVEN_247441-1 [Araneus ventricosus]|uniref:Uncharacterized protein n=1 Tax=Araneus ventricosus TaxID=182803 RepID=A0A4Y2REP1_ARAVE|nr:hypothetical protein AVEN_247441-1 [Araneus ventricosus]
MSILRQYNLNIHEYDERCGTVITETFADHGENTQYEEIAEKCLLCEDYVVTDKCGVGEKGIDGLIKANIARKDGKHELFRGQKKVVLHASCRKKYTRPQSIIRDCHGICTNGAPLEEEEFELDRNVAESNEI